MAETNQFNIEVGVDTKDSINKLKELSSTLGNVASSVKGSTSQMSGGFKTMSTNVASSMSLIGKALVFGSFGVFIKSALQTSAQLEQTAISFEVFTGSAEVANNMLGQLKDQALNSPMQFQDIANGAKTLLGYGLTAEQVIPITKMLGDVSGGNADKFARLSLAFGQVNAAGRLMGQEARQMVNAGFNPLQAISDKTGVSMAVLTEKMKKGQISVKDVGDAFTYATSEGGRFFGMADRQSQTLQGQFNKLSESVTFAMAEIGTSISENLQLGDVIAHISVIVEQLKNNFINLNKETNNSSEFNRLLKGILDVLGITVDLTVKAFGLLSLILGNLLKLGAPVVDFFDFLDAAIIKSSKILPSYIADIGKLIKYVNEFAKVDSTPKTIVESIDFLEKKVAVLEDRKIYLEFGSFGYKELVKDIDKYKSEINDLKANSGKINLLSGLNDKPPGLGDSELTKAEKAKYDALAEQARIGFTNINKQMRTGFESKLDIFDRYAKEELNKFKEFGINTAKVEKAQYAMRQQIAQVELAKLSEIVNKNSSIEGLKKSLFKMVDAQVEAISRIMSPMDKSIANTPKKTMAEFIDAFGSDEVKIDKAFNDLIAQNKAGAINDYATSILAAQQDFAMSVAGGFGEMAGSVLSGESTISDAFNNLGKVFTSAVGELLIQIGTSAVKLGLAKLGIEAALTAAFGGGGTMVAIGLGAIAAGMALKKTGSKSVGGSSGSMSASAKMPSMASRASGASYQYGGASFSNQSVRLSIDLTGSITATQTGYSINKSLETTLRITGQ